MQGLAANESQILYGEDIVDAIYSDQIVQDYESNPLIEALPPIFTEDEVIEQISVFRRLMKRTEIKSKLSIPLYSKIVSILSAF